MPELPPPIKVSPLIKFFRYTFLVTGVVYGYLKQEAFRGLEAGKAEERAKKRTQRDVRLVEERRLAVARDFKQIVEIFSPPPKVQSAEIFYDVDMEVVKANYNMSTQDLSNDVQPDISHKVGATEEDISKIDDYSLIPVDAEIKVSEIQESVTTGSNNPCDMHLPEKLDESGYIITDFESNPILSPDDKGSVSSEN